MLQIPQPKSDTSLKTSANAILQPLPALSTFNHESYNWTSDPKHCNTKATKQRGMAHDLFVSLFATWVCSEPKDSAVRHFDKASRRHR
jgi:hypothetical protein